MARYNAAMHNRPVILAIGTTMLIAGLLIVLAALIGGFKVFSGRDGVQTALYAGIMLASVGGGAVVLMVKK